MNKINNYFKFGILLYFAYVYTTIFVYIFRINQKGGDNWHAADWYITYKFGPVRKGMIGNLLFSVSKNTEIFTGLITLINVSIYLLIIFLTINIFFKFNQNIYSYFLLFSPLFLMFPRLDLAGSYRKEIIGLLSFLIYLTFLKIKHLKVLYLISLILIFIGVFSSEVNIFILPFMVLVSKKYSNTFTKDSFIFILILFSYLIFYFFFDQSKKIRYCDLLVSNYQSVNPSICNGTFYWYELSFLEQINEVTKHITTIGILTTLITFLLSLLPLLAERTWLKNNKRDLSFIFAFFIPLFIIAIDWGRWIHIFMFCVTVIYFIDQKTSRKNFKFIHLISLLIYISTWKVPHLIANQSNSIFLKENFFQFFINILTRDGFS